MKKYILILLFACIVPSCEFYNETGGISWYSKICNWQDRESQCLNYPEIQTAESFSFTPSTLTRARNTALESFRSAPEGVEYWETSCEAWNLEEGDCDTAAFRIWGTLRYIGFPDDLIRLFVVKVAENEHHMFVAVYYTPDKFYVIDNGAFTSNIANGEEFLDKFQLEPVVAFNLFSYWDFRK